MDITKPELYPERLSEFYETLAWHYVQGHVQGEVWPKAVEYLLRAADKARAQYAYAEALVGATRRSVFWTGTVVRPARKCERSSGSDLHSLQGTVTLANDAYERAIEYQGYLRAQAALSG